MMNSTIIQWVKERPLVLIALCMAALGLVVLELLPARTAPRNPMSDKESWEFVSTADCHPGTWRLRIEGDSVRLDHDGIPGKAVTAKVSHPDEYSVAADLSEDVGFGPAIRLVTLANLPGGRARLYLSQNAGLTHCVHDLSDH
jgi:hypothetical protein